MKVSGMVKGEGVSMNIPSDLVTIPKPWHTLSKALDLALNSVGIPDCHDLATLLSTGTDLDLQMSV